MFAAGDSIPKKKVAFANRSQANLRDLLARMDLCFLT